MEVQTVFQLVALLLLGICTRGGKAQVECYSEEHCPENVPELIIGEFNSAKECCILDEALSWQTAEPCAACLIYGWKETFSEAGIGDTLTLTVGTIKGSPEGRVILGVEYNNTEVSVDATDFDPTRFIWAAEDLSLQVTVLDDGQPLQEDKNITLTLAKIAGGKSSDIIVTEVIIAVRAQKIPVMVGFNSTSLTVSESDGLAIACITAIAPSPTDPVTVTVNVFAIGGTATAADMEPPLPATLTLIPDSTQCVQVPLIAGDGYEHTEMFSLLLTTTAGANVDIVRNVTEITILDSDMAFIVLSPEIVEIMEGDEEVQTLCVSINNSAVDVDVYFSESDLSQLVGDLLPIGMFESEVTLLAQGPPYCLEYSAIDDDVIEGTEVLEVTWMGRTPRVVPATVIMTILDNDMLPSPSPSPPPSPSPTPPPPTRRIPTPEQIADTVSGGAFLAALINAHSTDTDAPMEMALCYEVHGLQGRYFNLVSEPCLYVNAHYMVQDPDKPLHFIDEIAVVATNAEGANIEMKIDRHCNLLVGGSTTSTVFLNSSGVLAEAIPAFNDVVIVATDCGRDRETVLWIRCVPHEHGFMQLDISRDLGLRNSSSHGLLGQFWGVSIPVSNYGENPDDYLIEIPFHGGINPRKIVGSSHKVTWEYRRLKCLYVGDRQGGRGAGIHGGPNQPLIDGDYIDYLTDGPFDTDFIHSHFGQ